MLPALSGGELNSPWGVAVTPQTFGTIPNRLLIGNFGDGRVHVYTFDAAAGLARVQLEGSLGGSDATPLIIDGLWALRFGIDSGGFRSDTLYFTAGPERETHGIFGSLTAQATPPVVIPQPTYPASH